MDKFIIVGISYPMKIMETASDFFREGRAAGKKGGASVTNPYADSTVPSVLSQRARDWAAGFTAGLEEYRQETEGRPIEIPTETPEGLDSEMTPRILYWAGHDWSMDRKRAWEYKFPDQAKYWAKKLWDKAPKQYRFLQRIRVAQLPVEPPSQSIKEDGKDGNAQ